MKKNSYENLIRRTLVANEHIIRLAYWCSTCKDVTEVASHISTVENFQEMVWLAVQNFCWHMCVIRKFCLIKMMD